MDILTKKIKGAPKKPAQSPHLAETADYRIAHADEFPQANAIIQVMHTIAGFLLCYAINILFFPEDMGFLKQPLSPYLVVVLIIALRYGTIAGVGSAVAASALFVYHAFTGTSGDEASSAFSYLSLIQPILFIGLGAALGELRNTINEQREALEARTRNLEHFSSSLQLENEKVRRINEDLYDELGRVSDDLRERVSTTTEIAGMFYEAASRAETLDMKTVPVAICEIVQRFCGALCTAIYTRERGGFRTLHIEGGGLVADFLPDESPPVAQLLRSGMVVSAEDVMGSNSAEAKPFVLAAPLFSGEDQEEISGLLCIVDMLPENLNVASRFSLLRIADWGSRVLRNAHIMSNLRNTEPEESQSQTLKPEHFTKLIEQEWERAKRYRVPLSLLHLKLQGIERLKTPQKVEALRETLRLLQEETRTVDLIGRIGVAGGFGVLLPHTPQVRVYALVARLNSLFLEQSMKKTALAALQLHFGLGFHEVEQESWEPMVRSANRFFRWKAS